MGKLQGELALLSAAFFWGGTFVVVKEALVDSSPIAYLAIRFTIAAVLFPLMVLRRLRPVPGREVLRGAVLTGLCLGVGMIFQTVGLKYTSAANSGFLTSLYIVLVPFVATLVYGTRTGKREWMAVGLALCGIALLTLDPAHLDLNRGDLYTVAASTVFAFQLVLVNHYSKADSFLWMAWLQISVTAVVAWTGLLIGLEPGAHYSWTPRFLTALAITVVCATLAAFLLQSWGQRHTTPTRAALVMATEPVFAGLTSFFYLGEQFGLRALSGAGLILAAVVLAELKPSSHPEHSR